VCISGAYRADPVDVGADLGEDGGFLDVVAAKPGAKADDTMNLPGAVRVLTVQRTTGVSLNHHVGEKVMISEQITHSRVSDLGRYSTYYLSYLPISGD